MDQNRYYIRDGVLVAEYNSDLGVETVLESIEALCQIVPNKEDALFPIVVVFKKDLHVDFNPSHFSRLIDNKLIPHISSVFIVAKNSRVLQGAKVVNSMFLGGKARFIEEFDQAFAAAKAAREQNQPILEQ